MANYLDGVLGLANPIAPTQTIAPLDFNVAPYATTTAAAADGVLPGAIYLLANGNRVSALQANGTITANEAITPVTGSSATDLSLVVATSAAEQLVSGFNDLYTAASVSSGNVFYATTQGTGFPLIAASQSAAKFMVSTSTGGTLTTFTAGTDIQSNVYALKASGGSGGATLSVIV